MKSQELDWHWDASEDAFMHLGIANGRNITVAQMESTPNLHISHISNRSEKNFGSGLHKLLVLNLNAK